MMRVIIYNILIFITKTYKENRNVCKLKYTYYNLIKKTPVGVLKKQLDLYNCISF